jgi:hypothetical protein
MRYEYNTIKTRNDAGHCDFTHLYVESFDSRAPKYKDRAPCCRTRSSFKCKSWEVSSNAATFVLFVLYTCFGFGALAPLCLQLRAKIDQSIRLCGTFASCSLRKQKSDLQPLLLLFLY